MLGLLLFVRLEKLEFREVFRGQFGFRDLKKAEKH
jgi:hypothetical protein